MESARTGYGRNVSSLVRTFQQIRTILFANATMATWRCRRVSTCRNHWPSEDWLRFKCTNERLGALDEEFANLGVATLADRAKRRLPTGRVLPRYESKPGGHVATAREHAAIANGGDHGCGDQGTNARNRYSAATEGDLRRA